VIELPVTHAALVDQNRLGDFHLVQHLQGDVQVVQAKGSGLGDQQAEVAPSHRLHHRTRGAGRAIDDHRIALGPLFYCFDERSGPGLAKGQLSPDDIHATGTGVKYLPYRSRAFAYGLLRADDAASPAAVAQLGKEQNCLRKDGQSVIGAEICAFAAVAALRFIY